MDRRGVEEGRDERNQNALHSVELSKNIIKKKNKTFKISNTKKYLTRGQKWYGLFFIPYDFGKKSERSYQ